MERRTLANCVKTVVVAGIAVPALLGCLQGDSTPEEAPTRTVEVISEPQATLDRSAVHFGMTKEEALRSSWGAPLSEEDIGAAQGGGPIIRLRYPHDQYLYFEADRLVGVMQRGIVERKTTEADEKRRRSDERLEARAVERFKREDVARRRQEGVRIGMTEEHVLQSSWGRPQRVNRTTTRQGVREQWVYARGYLYFEDGSLVSIQE